MIAFVIFIVISSLSSTRKLSCTNRGVVTAQLMWPLWVNYTALGPLHTNTRNQTELNNCARKCLLPAGSLFLNETQTLWKANTVVHASSCQHIILNHSWAWRVYGRVPHPAHHFPALSLTSMKTTRRPGRLQNTNHSKRQLSHSFLQLSSRLQLHSRRKQQQNQGKNSLQTALITGSHQVALS